MLTSFHCEGVGSKGSIPDSTSFDKWETRAIEVKSLAAQVTEKGWARRDAKYAHNQADEEEYIDLRPVLEALYIDPDAFLRPIKGVTIVHE